MTIHLLCPLSFEAHILSKGLSGVPQLPKATVVGPGSGARSFIETRSESGDVAILVGTAGAIRTPHPPAAWLSTIERVDRTGDEVWRSPFFDRLVRADGVESGRSVGGLTVNGVIHTPREKAALAEGYPEATLIDLESWSFAETCHRRNVQWLVLRGVSDGPNDTLPADVATWVTPRGSTRLWGVLASLIRQPHQLPAMKELGVRSTTAMLEAAQVLRRAAEALGRLTGASEAPRQAEVVPHRSDELPALGGDDE